MRSRFFCTLLIATSFSFSPEAMANEKMDLDGSAKTPYSAKKRTYSQAIDNDRVERDRTLSPPLSKKLKFSEEEKRVQATSALNVEAWQNILSFLDDVRNLADVTQGTYLLLPTFEKSDILKIPTRYKQTFLIKLSLLAAAETFNEDWGWHLPFNPLLTYQHNRAVTRIIQTFGNKEFLHSLGEARYSYVENVLDKLIMHSPERNYFMLDQSIEMTLNGLQNLATNGNKKSSEFISWLHRYDEVLKTTKPKFDAALMAIHKNTVHGQDTYFNVDALLTEFILGDNKTREAIIIDCWKNNCASLLPDFINKLPLEDISIINFLDQTIQNLKIFCLNHELSLEDFINYIRINRHIPAPKPTIEKQVKDKQSLLEALENLKIDFKNSFLTIPTQSLSDEALFLLGKLSLEDAIGKISAQAQSYKLTPLLKQGFKLILQNISEEEIEAYLKKEASTQSEKLALLDKHKNNRQLPTFPIGKFITYLWTEHHPKNPLSDRILTMMAQLSHSLSPFHKIQADKIYSELVKKTPSLKNVPLNQELRSESEKFFSDGPPLSVEISFYTPPALNPTEDLHYSMDATQLQHIRKPTVSEKRLQEMKDWLSLGNIPRKTPLIEIIAMMESWLEAEKITSDNLKKGLTEPFPNPIQRSFL